MSSHTYKNQMEKANYKRYIRQLDYEPTLNESVNFPESDKTDKEFSISNVPDTKRESNSEIIGEYIKKNWLPWSIGIFAFILIFLTVDSKVDIATIFEKTETIKENLDEIKDDIEDIKKTNHNQDLKIQENKFKTEEVEKELKRTPTRGVKNAG